ncbi:MAG: transcriptional regulator [Alphaproteobacteria bacterium]|nr:transcriptional regulator [Alphaproteobacteria bacterium]
MTFALVAAFASSSALSNDQSAGADPADSEPAFKAELVMFERDGCEYCALWNEQIGVAYPKTWEGRAAPLRRVDLFGALSPELEAISRPRFTPTFVLMVDDREVGRIRGHPGEDFFWPMLSELLAKGGITEP